MMYKSKYHPLRLLGLIVILAWAATPILFLVISSIKEPREIFSFPPAFIFEPTLINFENLFSRWPGFLRALRNSVIVTAGATVLTIVPSFFAGYALSRYRRTALSATAFGMIIVRMLPPIIISIPLFPLFHNIGLFDRLIVLVILYATFFVSLGSMLMRTFIDQVPIELEQSAQIDGAHLGTILWRIVFPLSIHGIIATATFVIIFAWKEFLFAYIFTSTSARTAPIIINEMMASITGVQWGPVFAAAVIQLVPIIIYVIAVQKFLAEGLTVGGVKQ